MTGWASKSVMSQMTPPHGSYSAQLTKLQLGKSSGTNSVPCSSLSEKGQSRCEDREVLSLLIRFLQKNLKMANSQAWTDISSKLLLCCCRTGSRQLYVVSFTCVEIKSWMHSKRVIGSAITTDNYQMPLFHLQQKNYSQTKFTTTLPSLIYINHIWS